MATQYGLDPYEPRSSMSSITPTAHDLSTDILTPIITKYWSSPQQHLLFTTTQSQELIDTIYYTELINCDQSNPSVQLLDLTQYLDRFLWPLYNPYTSSYAHVMSLIIMINVRLFTTPQINIWDLLLSIPSSPLVHPPLSLPSSSPVVTTTPTPDTKNITTNDNTTTNNNDKPIIVEDVNSQIDNVTKLTEFLKIVPILENVFPKIPHYLTITPSTTTTNDTNNDNNNTQRNNIISALSIARPLPTTPIKPLLPLHSTIIPQERLHIVNFIHFCFKSLENQLIRSIFGQFISITLFRWIAPQFIPFTSSSELTQFQNNDENQVFKQNFDNLLRKLDFQTPFSRLNNAIFPTTKRSQALTEVTNIKQAILNDKYLTPTVIFPFLVLRTINIIKYLGEFKQDIIVKKAKPVPKRKLDRAVIKRVVKGNGKNQKGQKGGKMTKNDKRNNMNDGKSSSSDSSTSSSGSSSSDSDSSDSSDDEIDEDLVRHVKNTKENDDHGKKDDEKIEKIEKKPTTYSDSMVPTDDIHIDFDTEYGTLLSLAVRRGYVERRTKATRAIPASLLPLLLAKSYQDGIQMQIDTLLKHQEALGKVDAGDSGEKNGKSGKYQKKNDKNDKGMKNNKKNQNDKDQSSIQSKSLLLSTLESTFNHNIYVKNAKYPSVMTSIDDDKAYLKACLQQQSIPLYKTKLPATFHTLYHRILLHTCEKSLLLVIDVLSNVDLRRIVLPFLHSINFVQSCLHLPFLYQISKKLTQNDGIGNDNNEHGTDNGTMGEYDTNFISNNKNIFVFNLTKSTQLTISSLKEAKALFTSLETYLTMEDTSDSDDEMSLPSKKVHSLTSLQHLFSIYPRQLLTNLRTSISTWLFEQFSQQGSNDGDGDGQDNNNNNNNNNNTTTTQATSSTTTKSSTPQSQTLIISPNITHSTPLVTNLNIQPHLLFQLLSRIQYYVNFNVKLKAPEPRSSLEYLQEYEDKLQNVQIALTKSINLYHLYQKNNNENDEKDENFNKDNNNNIDLINIKSLIESIFFTPTDPTTTISQTSPEYYSLYTLLTSNQLTIPILEHTIESLGIYISHPLGPNFNSSPQYTSYLISLLITYLSPPNNIYKMSSNLPIYPTTYPVTHLDNKNDRLLSYFSSSLSSSLPYSRLQYLTLHDLLFTSYYLHREESAFGIVAWVYNCIVNGLRPMLRFKDDLTLFKEPKIKCNDIFQLSTSLRIKTTQVAIVEPSLQKKVIQTDKNNKNKSKSNNGKGMTKMQKFVEKHDVSVNYTTERISDLHLALHYTSFENTNDNCYTFPSNISAPSANTTLPQPQPTLKQKVRDTLPRYMNNAIQITKIGDDGVLGKIVVNFNLMNNQRQMQSFADISTGNVLYLASVIGTPVLTQLAQVGNNQNNNNNNNNQNTTYRINTPNLIMLRGCEVIDVFDDKDEPVQPFHMIQRENQQKMNQNNQNNNQNRSNKRKDTEQLRTKYLSSITTRTYYVRFDPIQHSKDMEWFGKKDSTSPHQLNKNIISNNTEFGTSPLLSSYETYYGNTMLPVRSNRLLPEDTIVGNHQEDRLFYSLFNVLINLGPDRSQFRPLLSSLRNSLKYFDSPQYGITNSIPQWILHPLLGYKLDSVHYSTISRHFRDTSRPYLQTLMKNKNGLSSDNIAYGDIDMIYKMQPKLPHFARFATTFHDIEHLKRCVPELVQLLVNNNDNNNQNGGDDEIKGQIMGIDGDGNNLDVEMGKKIVNIIHKNAPNNNNSSLHPPFLLNMEQSNLYYNATTYNTSRDGHGFDFNGNNDSNDDCNNDDDSNKNNGVVIVSDPLDQEQSAAIKMTFKQNNNVDNDAVSTTTARFHPAMKYQQRSLFASTMANNTNNAINDTKDDKNGNKNVKKQLSVPQLTTQTLEQPIYFPYFYLQLHNYLPTHSSLLPMYQKLDVNNAIALDNAAGKNSNDNKIDNNINHDNKESNNNIYQGPTMLELTNFKFKLLLSNFISIFSKYLPQRLLSHLSSNLPILSADQNNLDKNNQNNNIQKNNQNNNPTTKSYLGPLWNPAQVESIRSALNPGLTMIKGPAGCGKTATLVQIVSELIYNYPSQRILILTQSNAGVDEILLRILRDTNIDSRYILRLGHKHDDLAQKYRADINQNQSNNPLDQPSTSQNPLQLNQSKKNQASVRANMDNSIVGGDKNDKNDQNNSVAQLQNVDFSAYGRANHLLTHTQELLSLVGLLNLSISPQQRADLIPFIQEMEEKGQVNSNFVSKNQKDENLSSSSTTMSDDKNTTKTLSSSITAIGIIDTCYSALHFYNKIIKPLWSQYIAICTTVDTDKNNNQSEIEQVHAKLVQNFPFSAFFIGVGHKNNANGIFTTTSYQCDLYLIQLFYTFIQYLFQSIQELSPLLTIPFGNARNNFIQSTYSRVLGATVAHLITQRNDSTSITTANRHNVNVMQNLLNYDTILIEEAGQLLDLNTILSLLSQQRHSRSSTQPQHFLQRIVMIGDIKQLPPLVQHIDLLRLTNFGQSLFYRFLALGARFITLNEQGRAHPTISHIWKWVYNTTTINNTNSGNNNAVTNVDNDNLSTTTTTTTKHKDTTSTIITHTIQDLPQTLSLPSYIRGVLHNSAAIIMTEGKEERVLNTNIQNRTEAEMICNFYIYLLLQGRYNINDIAIVVAYREQLTLIQQQLMGLLRQYRGVLPHFQSNNNQNQQNDTISSLYQPRIATVDQFQGQQANIVLLSFVRTDSPGYLRDVRRLLVAFSRARIGCYAFLNQNLLSICPQLYSFVSNMKKQQYGIDLCSVQRVYDRSSITDNNIVNDISDSITNTNRNESNNESKMCDDIDNDDNKKDEENKNDPTDDVNVDKSHNTTNTTTQQQPTIMNDGYTCFYPIENVITCRTVNDLRCHINEIATKIENDKQLMQQQWAEDQQRWEQEQEELWQQEQQQQQQIQSLWDNNNNYDSSNNNYDDTRYDNERFNYNDNYNDNNNDRSSRHQNQHEQEGNVVRKDRYGRIIK